MIENILKVVNLYGEGLDEIQKRRSQWLLKYKELRAHMKEIATQLNNTATYKAGFFVDTSHAFNEEINGTCAEMPSLTFRCGDMPLMISFRSAVGERRDYMEEGFQLAFTPTVTGQILVLVQPHINSLNNEKLEMLTLSIIDQPANITIEDIDQLIAKGIEAAFYSSFTGILHLQKREMNESQKQQQYSPIGFKRYESTEKVK